MLGESIYHIVKVLKSPYSRPCRTLFGPQFGSSVESRSETLHGVRQWRKNPTGHLNYESHDGPKETFDSLKRNGIGI